LVPSLAAAVGAGGGGAGVPFRAGSGGSSRSLASDSNGDRQTAVPSGGLVD
jgi:hypothetical protein